MKAIVIAGFLGLSWLTAAHGANNAIVAEPYVKPEITEISDVPWTPPAPRPRAKVIYGEDDRIDVYQETDPDRREWANATCALINLSRMTQNSDGSWTISSPGAYQRWGLPACEGEPFGDQPTAAFCTGFMVSDDLIATAGHCYTTSSISSVAFVFGFWMLDETTPRLHFDASEVYTGVEVISYSGSGSYDHSVVRVDRPISAPGAQSLPIRRGDSIMPGEYVGVIGHPAGLPMKIAFGDTYVRYSDHEGYFVANLDTYGGNSGSPVFNAVTGVVEGILVRGATDYIRNYDDNCFESNVCPNDGCRGEDATKTTVFSARIPLDAVHTGSIALDYDYYRCEDILTITVVDPDLIGQSAMTVLAETASGDEELVALYADSGAPDTFTGAIALLPGAATPGSGALEVSHDDLITAYYEDAEDEEGQPATHTATALVDCVPPQIILLDIPYVSGTQAQLYVETDQPAKVAVHYGRACDNLANISSTLWDSHHTFALASLSKGVSYFFVVVAEDQAGNTTLADNGGACYTFQTRQNFNYMTEHFSITNPLNLSYHQSTFTPGDYPSYFQACTTTADALPVMAGGETLILGDDDYIEIPFTHGAPISFYGNLYDRMFLGSNGYITFGVGDVAYQGTYYRHFQLPRISPLMCDLNPEIRGDVYFAQVSDRYAITFVDVPVYSNTGQYPPENANTFQVEVFFNGAIRFTWLNLHAVTVVVGLSAGLGVPNDYLPTRLVALTDCDSSNPDGIYHSADTDANGRISFDELLQVIQLYNVGQYHCDPAFGYAPGDGPRDCLPHDSDYVPTDWRISLSELLRLIQLYNAGAYLPDPTTEDGFRPAP